MIIDAINKGNDIRDRAQARCGELNCDGHDHWRSTQVLALCDIMGEELVAMRDKIDALEFKLGTHDHGEEWGKS